MRLVFESLGYPLIYITFYFSIYSFLGWCLETVFATIKNKRITNRGFLYGPFCPMYGFCSVIIILLSKPIEKNYVTLYLVCFLGASIIEYLTGFILEELFQAKWWDYSKRPLNLQGRVCLLYSLIWGFVGVFLIKVLQPVLSVFVDKAIASNLAWLFTCTLILYLLFDFTKTLIKLSELKSLFLQLYEVSSEIKNILTNLKTVAQDRVTIVGNMSKDKLSEAESFSRDLWSKVDYSAILPRELKERYDNIIDKIASSYSRLFIAFPQLSSNRLKKAFADVREKIKRK